MGLKYYKNNKVKCLKCGDVLEYEHYSKSSNSSYMSVCRCGAIGLDPAASLYRICLFDATEKNYEDLSEEWDEEAEERARVRMERMKQELGQWKNAGALTFLEQNRLEVLQEAVVEDEKRIDEKISEAGQDIIQKHIGALRELAKGPEE